jgi:predicted RNA-binding Zn-ribbon protein involved in translation (DUF1610 family)
MVAFRRYSVFRSATIICAKCGWSGQGRQTTVGKFFVEGMVTEYHCPQCCEYVCIAPWPKIGENQE